MRYSAICTALRAAPLRIWSPVSHSVQVVVVGQVLTDAAYVDIVLAGALQGHGIDILVVGVVHQRHAGSLGQSLTYFFNAERSLGLEPHALGVAAQQATRTQVAEVRTSECMILRVSLYIFISSLV